VGGVAVLLLAVAGIVKAMSGQSWTLPVVGEYASRAPF